MKKLLVIGCILLSATTGFAQDKKGATATKNDTAQKEPLLSPRASFKTDNISVSYGQPSKKGRVIFGSLVPYEQVWRTGANEATEVTFYRDAVIGNLPIKKGTYTLFTIPREKAWNVILNSQLGQWGAYEYEKYKSKNIADFYVPVQTLDTTLEQLSFGWKNDMLLIAWDKTFVGIPMKFIKK